MQLLRHRSVSKRGWRGALIVIAICSLTFSLATRFWATSDSPSHTVRTVDRRSVEPKRQHLNRDAIRWAAPAADFSIIEPAPIEAALALAGPPLPKHVFSDSLYNRPPPSSDFLV
jgi:hypothetical protein